MINPQLFQLICFYAFAGVTVAAALAVITLRNSVHAVLALVLTFFSSACLWLLAEAEFLAIALIVVYVGAVMVLFLFVVMMLDIDQEKLREGFVKFLPVGLIVAVVMLVEMLALIGVRAMHATRAGRRPGRGRGRVQYRVAGPGAVHAVPAAVRDRRADPHRGRGGRGGADPAPARRCAPPVGQRSRSASRRTDRVRVVKMAADCLWPASRRRAGPDRGAQAMITLSHYIVLGAVLFCISVAGLFINRKNVIVLLMAIELMLLAVNMNFVAFSRFLGDVSGQVFVFFILTVAAAESAIGLAILVLLFRNRSTINVAEIDSMKG